MTPVLFITLEDLEILEAARKIGVKAEVVRKWERLVSDEELGTRSFIYGGEVQEIPLPKTDNEDLPF